MNFLKTGSWLRRGMRRSGVLAAAALAIAGCSGSSLKSASASAINQEASAGYRLAAGDKLRISVFDEPTLTGEYEVGLDGNLAMPLIEPIATAGLTSKELAGRITQHLASGGYVLTPIVSVEITEHRPFYIMGEVNTPGKYGYNADLTLAQAIAMAGGYTARANKRTVILQRQNWPEARQVKVDGAALKVSPGDTIIIKEAFF